MKKFYSVLALVMISAMAFGASVVPSKSGKTRSQVSAAGSHSVTRLSPVGTNHSAAAFWTDDFSNPANWTRTPVAGTDNWVIGTAGPAGAFAISAITSATASNGFALFDSDLLCSGNQIANLTTANSINCSGRSAVRLTFSQYYRRYYDSTYVFVSNNNTTWTRFEVNAGLTNNAYGGGSAAVNPDIKTLDISSVAANQATVWIRFQFYSPSSINALAGCAYAWMIDDVSLEEPQADDVSLAVAGYASRYTSMPILQTSPLTPNARVYNNGSAPASNVSVSVEIFDASFNSVFQATTNTVASLNAGDTTASLTTANTYLPVDTGIYYILYIAQMTNPDGNSSNDSALAFVYVDDSVYGRDQTFFDVDAYEGGFGFNGATGILGQKYTVRTPSQFTSATFFIDNNNIGSTFSVDVYDVVGGLPTNLIGTTNAYTITANDTGGAFITLPFASPVSVTAGDYFVGVSQLDTNNISLGAASDIWTANSIYFSINGGAFTPVENNAVPLLITWLLRVNNPSSTAVGINSVDAAANVLVFPNPSRGTINIMNNGVFSKDVTVTVTNNLGQVVLNRAFSTFNNERIDLGTQADGIYTVKITDANTTVSKNVVVSNK